jgi:hypothetical protein
VATNVKIVNMNEYEFSMRKIGTCAHDIDSRVRIRTNSMQIAAGLMLALNDEDSKAT